MGRVVKSVVGLRRFVGGLHWNSVIPSDAISYPVKIFFYGGGGLCKNLVTQVTIFLIIFNIFLLDKSYANNQIKIYKQEYFFQLNYNFDQAYCLVDLMHHENRSWDVDAQNGSHHGLPQGRSEYLAKVGYKKQIAWHVKYVKNRYGTDTFGDANFCAAYAHWKKKGWH